MGGLQRGRRQFTGRWKANTWLKKKNVGPCRDNGTQSGFSSRGPVEFLPPHLDCVFCRML